MKRGLRFQKWSANFRDTTLVQNTRNNPLFVELTRFLHLRWLVSIFSDQANSVEILPRNNSLHVALETGTHSPWVSRQLTQLGHEVRVAHARNVRLIGESSRKDDPLDARTLARLARIDPGLLGPVRHRSAKAQIHLTVIRARAALVGTRTALVNAARGLTKSYGQRLRKCGTEQMNREIAKGLSQELQEALDPLLAEIESLNEGIAEYDGRIEKIAKEVYSQVAVLKQVKGVGTLIALTYVLTLDDPHRFRRSRDVGCFVGLRPGRRNSGLSEPQLHISKEGDRYLRTLLVQGAHYSLGPFGQDSDLRRWGLKLGERGGEECQETSRRCGRAEVGRTASQAVGQWRGL